jgi:glycosyltransferase involved in cell wall biosynthesis
MRVGHNPARFVEKVAQPTEITITVVNCIPFVSGYYEQCLDVLKACVTSLHGNTPELHDLMVFDNHSCPEVREYLQEAYTQGLIQYLVLSDTNIGKLGAWNFMFGAAQGKYVVFSDGDIYFRPGWLKASLELFETFPDVGMVTARPVRSPIEFSSATLEWARRQPAGVLEEGNLLDWETFLEHALSLGLTEEKARDLFPKGQDYRLTLNGKAAFIGAGHFQFMAPREVLQSLLPIPSEQPMRGERTLDIRFNEIGKLRLTTTSPFVAHMGNRLPQNAHLESAPKRKSLVRRFFLLPGIRHVLLWINNRIFRLYFNNVE